MTNKIIDYLMERFDKHEDRTNEKFDKIYERFEKMDKKIDKLIEFKWRVVGVMCGIGIALSLLYKLADLFLKAAA